ncbi:MAG: cupin domain-containing protein [Candidatus Gastranaerophilaceae bacterium]
MFYNVLNAKDLVNEEKFNKKNLMEHNESSLSVIGLKKEEIIDTHTSISDAAVYVLDGKIQLHFNAEEFTVEKGQMLLFKKDTEHKVLALKDSKFLLIKI